MRRGGEQGFTVLRSSKGGRQQVLKAIDDRAEGDGAAPPWHAAGPQQVDGRHPGELLCHLAMPRKMSFWLGSHPSLWCAQKTHRRQCGEAHLSTQQVALTR